MNIDLNNTYWEKIIGFVSEHRIDFRWLLKNYDNDRTYGSLRIVSHPDIPPGHLRAFFTYIETIEEKNDNEIMQSIEDYQVDITELEVYSIDEKIETKSEKVEAPYSRLEEIFDIKIFE